MAQTIQGGVNFNQRQPEIWLTKVSPKCREAGRVGSSFGRRQEADSLSPGNAAGHWQVICAQDFEERLVLL